MSQLYLKRGLLPPQRRCQGFTLIELLVATAVLVILLGVAVPSFNSVLASSRLTTVTNDLATAFQLARSEAIKRNRSVLVCPSDNGDSCSCSWSGKGWQDGWIVAVGSDTVDELIKVWPKPDTLVEFSEHKSLVAFSGTGEKKIATTVSITTAYKGCGSGSNRKLSVAPSGRVAVTREDCSI